MCPALLLLWLPVVLQHFLRALDTTLNPEQQGTYPVKCVAAVIWVSARAGQQARAYSREAETLESGVAKATALQIGWQTPVCSLFTACQ